MVNTKRAQQVMLLLSMGTIVISGCLNSPDVTESPIHQNPYIDMQNPTVRITAPDDGAYVSGTVEIVVEAADNIGIDHVEFYLDDTLLKDGTDETPPYICEWNTGALPDSTDHILYAVAYDTARNLSYSDTVLVRIQDYLQPPPDTEPPSVQIRSPEHGDSVSGLCTIRTYASDNVAIAYVELYLDGVIPPDGRIYMQPFEHVWDTRELPDGSGHTIAARIVDTSENEAFSDTIMVIVDNSMLLPDTEAPAVAITTPADDATVSGNVYICASAEDNLGVEQVAFFIDGVLIPNSVKHAPPYEYLWNSSAMVNGSVHTIVARAIDVSANTAYSETIHVTVNSLMPPPDTEPPSAQIVAPAEGANVSGTVTISSSASDNVGIDHVEFFVDGEVLPNNIDRSEPYEYAWDTTELPNGTTHALRVKAVDTSNNERFSSPVQVTILNYTPPPPDTQAPSVTISTPSNNNEVSGTVHVIAEATDNVGIDHVDFFIDGVQPAGATEYEAPYEYSWNTTGLTAGSAHTIVARATDTSDNVGISSTIHVTIESSGGGSSGVVLLEDVSNRQVFPTDNWWNLDVSGAPVDNNSQNYINWIGSGRTLHADFGGPPYGIPYSCVPGNQPLRAVYFYAYGDESDVGAPGQSPGYPIPDEAYLDANYIEGGVPGGGSSGDRHLIVIDRDKWLLFELFGARWNFSQQRWEAASGAVFNLSTNDRRPEGWTSGDAAGLAVFPGLIRYDEVSASGEIEHAFRFTSRATNGYVWPASHAAGTTSGALPMGARLRLKASVNISGYSPAVQKMLRAMKKYGLILADNGSDMFIQGTMDSRWDIGSINSVFHAIPASDFEVIQLGWNPVGH